MPRPSRSEDRKLRTTERVLTAAESAFAERGYNAVSIESISEAADVSIGTIYNRFGSKDGLYQAVVERALRHDEEIMRPAYDPALTAVEQLEAAGRAYVRFYLERPEHFRIVAFPQPLGDHEASQQIARDLADRVARLNGQVTVVLERAVAGGEIRPVDVERMTTVLWASWNGIVALGWRSDRLGVDRAELERLLEVAHDLVRHGLLVAG